MSIYWGDFHTNMHTEHLDDYENWYAFAKEMVDVWGPVYYPYYSGASDSGFKLEMEQEKEVYKRDFEKLRSCCKNKTDDEMIVYLSYEWQGNGQDGDHNIFFENHDGIIAMPRNYTELKEELSSYNVLAIPHHIAYMPGHRGKNWETHDETFSPVAEIYSSHGSSESSDCSIPLNVHVHMGPRVDKGSYLYALQKGIKVGAIASGDNHAYPTISGNGFMGIISDSFNREAIFTAIQKRHTYAITRNKIAIDYRVDTGILGDTVKFHGDNHLTCDINAGSAIDHVVLYKNGVAEKVFNHTGEWEKKNLSETVRFKFEVELGWGPDRRVFTKIGEKIWNVKIATDGAILSVEKLWTSPGCAITKQNKQEIEAIIKTRKEKANNEKLSQKNYLTPQIQNQSMIFEIEDRIEHFIRITIDDKEYNLQIKEMLQQANLFAKEKEVEELLEKTYNFTEFYREDAWWHHAYKILIHRAYPEQAYKMHIDYKITTMDKKEDSYFIKVIQKNGDTAWTSPIWIENKEEKYEQF